jgi:paraquat-inducible protein A
MPGSSRKNSLSARYRWRFEVPLLVLVSAGLLVVGLATPLMKVHKLIFWKNDYSVFTGIVGLMKDNQILLAAVLFFFSMVFPFAKLSLLLVLWWGPLAESRRRSMLKWLAVLGKWSMLDVFVVAILIVLVKIGPLASVEPQPGLYFFCFAILASMLTTMYVEHLAKR